MTKWHAIRTVAPLTALAFVLSSWALAAPPDTPARFAFLTPDEAQGRTLTADCDFFQNLTLFDLEVRLQKTIKPGDQARGLEELKELIHRSVTQWQPTETSALRGPVEGMVQQVRSLYPKISMPTIGLIKTNGREEGAASYTRGSFIVIPQSMLGPNATELLKHELFHVISRHNPVIRERLYEAIGFSKVRSFTPPSSLKRITNPDGVDYLWSIRLMSDGRQIEALPFVYSSREYRDGGLFNYVTFGFLELQNTGNGFTARFDRSGHPVVLRPQQLQGLFEQIGRNTQYIIHPDEILADNFKLLLAYKDPKRRSGIAARYDIGLLDKIDIVLKGGRVTTEEAERLQTPPKPGG